MYAFNYDTQEQAHGYAAVGTNIGAIYAAALNVADESYPELEVTGSLSLLAEYRPPVNFGHAVVCHYENGCDFRGEPIWFYP